MPTDEDRQAAQDILLDLEAGRLTPDQATTAIVSLGASEAEAAEMVEIANGGDDVLTDHATPDDEQ